MNVPRPSLLSWLIALAFVLTATQSPTHGGSTPQQPFTDSPLVPGVTAIRAVHVSELRTRIDRLRVLRRLDEYSWSTPAPASNGIVRAAAVSEMQNALNAAYVAVDLPTPTYTQSVTVGNVILAAHLNELRTAVQNLEATEPLVKMCSTEEPDLAAGFTTLAAGLFDCKWRDRTSLSVTFLDGDPQVQAKVREVALLWQPYLSMTLNFVDGPSADVRISFQDRGLSYSAVGSCTGGGSGRTMNYGWLMPTTTDLEYNRVVLHEFGHAIGLIHEHQSPAANIPWDVPQVYRLCRSMNPPWSDAKCDRNYFDRPQRSNFTQFDPLSIMLYPIDVSLTIGGFSTARNSSLSLLDRTFVQTWATNGPWSDWQSSEHQYLAGNWDRGDWQAGLYPGAKLAVRRNNFVLMAFNYDGVHDFVQGYGNGNSETEYLVGDWDGDGKDNLAVRQGQCVNMDFDFDGVYNLRQCYGNGFDEDQYLVGDWDGDGRDNLAVRKGNCVNMDFDFDGVHNLRQCFGNGPGEDQYLAGDWDGNGRDNLAVRRGNCVIMDHNFDGVGDFEQCYGNGSGEDEYMAADWDGDGRDNLAVRKGNCVNMDFNFDGTHDLRQCYGNGSQLPSMGALATPLLWNSRFVMPALLRNRRGSSSAGH